MIRPNPLPGDPRAREGSVVPVPVFACLDATGPDLALDGVARFRAFRPGRGETFEEFADPYPGSKNEAASARLHRRFGITGEDPGGKPSPREVARRFAQFLGAGPVVCLDRANFLPWFERLLGERARETVVLGIADLCRLLLPGRGTTEPERVVKALAPGKNFGPAGPAPSDLPSLLGALVAETLRLPARALGVAAGLLVELPARFERDDPGAARFLRAALDLLDRPGDWMRRDDPYRGELQDGAIRAAARSLRDAAAEVEKATPRFCEAAEGFPGDPLPLEAKTPVPLDEAERRALDLVFTEALPREFMAEAGETDPRPFYRKGQHELALRIADHLERGEFLAVDAPTGTGKTLAYLVPALLWSRRAGIRLAVSTFTRALQEQAFDREIPRALRVLRGAGVEGDFRVALLKGRANYVCGKKMRGLAPEGTEDGNDLLAWGIASLFYLCDPTGDLDRLPSLSPVPTIEDRGAEALRRAREVLRAESGCCTRKEDRRRCAAECARRAAERAHLVVTNHAFLLAMPEFFRHAIFDECDHLHPQALAAASVEVRLAALERLLRDVHAPGAYRARAILGEIARAARRAGRRLRDLDREDRDRGLPRALEEAEEAWGLAEDGLESFGSEVEAFAEWRERALEGREEREAHALLREYALAPVGIRFVSTRLALARSLSNLEAALGVVSEELALAPVRGAARARLRIFRARTLLAALAQGLEDFLPAPEGEAQFDPAYFYDVEEDPFRRGSYQCVRRVLLPNEFLGRRFLPPFRSAAFVSAANFLGGSFEAIEAYLGLDLLRETPPLDPSSAEKGRLVESFRAPGTFDYTRVLLAVPDDAAPFGNDRRARDRFVSYVAEFVKFLGSRTGGRMLALFTAAEDLRKVAEAVSPFFTSKGIPLYAQGTEGAGKEEIAERFRGRDDAILMGLDTFWFGVDFPGESVEYVVIVKLPYGRLDRYHWAQRAALGDAEHRRRIYLPRALGMFRQGFGRLMRRSVDHGAVFVLDRRLLDGRGRLFLNELPGLGPGSEEEGPRVVRASTGTCVREALQHMGLLADPERLGLRFDFPD